MFIRGLIALVFALGLTQPGCSGPYSGKAERLKKPRPKKPKKKEGEDEDKDKPKVAKLDDKCRTNFFADPSRVGRRRSRDARALANRANQVLVEAERVDQEERKPIVKDAIETLRSALDRDPYAPLATYKLAVAYALVGKKGCALALLERLKALQDYKPTEREARRTVKRAARDLAFDRFRDDARNALGE